MSSVAASVPCALREKNQFEVEYEVNYGLAAILPLQKISEIKALLLFVIPQIGMSTILLD
jgi:hypothetical protein